MARCKNNHEYTDLVCPDCAKQQSEQIPHGRLLSVLASGVAPFKWGGHITLSPDGWRRIGWEYQINLTTARFPALCGSTFTIAKMERGKVRKDNEPCPGCVKAFDALRVSA